MRLRTLSAFALTVAACALISLAADRPATAPAHAATSPLDLDGHPRDPFAAAAHARVFLFLRTDCPVGNRYAPELERVAKKFSGQQVEFWLVYPDPSENSTAIRNHIAQFHFPGQPLRDPQFQLVKRAHATIAPEAAVFDASGHLAYHGRIDDRWLDLGQARAAAQSHDLEDSIAAVLSGKPVAKPETRAVGCYLADLE